jgi:putative ATPase
MMDLFNLINEKKMETEAPLAERMKPKSLEDFVGQEHIVGEGKLLRKLIELDKLSSIILYGPPGSGKTSLAKVIANSTSSDFLTLNAVTSGVKDIRESIETAKANSSMYGRKTILFIDEIHRFNKSQQDALLPFVENGTVILIGATTENPYYEINNALISRSSVFRLNDLDEGEIESIVKSAVSDGERGLGMLDVSIDSDALFYLASKASGDARKALNALELAALTTEKKDGAITIDVETIKNSMQQGGFGYDKDGDTHYDIASAFIKSMRGSDPDATLHYLARMIEGGETVEFISRRIMILASEDIGNADPAALTLAVSAAQAVERIGMPEGRIILSQAAVYMACAPKSNACYTAIDDAISDIRKGGIMKVPHYLKDGTASSMAMKNEKDVEDQFSEYRYKYPHDFEGGYVEQEYMPDGVKGRKYYSPKEAGFESDIRKRLQGHKAK